MKSFPSLLAILDDLAGLPYLSIQAAINSAAPGDLIEVAPGTYAESLDLSAREVKIMGRRTSRDETILAPPAVATVFWANRLLLKPRETASYPRAVSVSYGVYPISSGVYPISSGVYPISSGVCPISSGVCPISSGVYPISSGVYPISSGVCPISSGVRPISSGVRPFSPPGLASALF